MADNTGLVTKPAHIIVVDSNAQKVFTVATNVETIKTLLQRALNTWTDVPDNLVRLDYDINKSDGIAPPFKEADIHER